jgi:hypothetical protein
VFKKLLNLSDSSSGILRNIEKVARLVAILVLVLDTLRFFQSGLIKIKDENPDTKTVALTAAPGGGGAASPSQEDEG